MFKCGEGFRSLPSANVLPVGEIDSFAFSEEPYPVVGYRAKWDRDSFEYRYTPRKFLQEPPNALLKNMKSAAITPFEWKGIICNESGERHETHTVRYYLSGGVGQE